MPTLYVFPKRDEPFSIELRGEAVTLGRASDNAIILNDPFCSSRHAAFRPSEGGYVLEDVGSKNGTFLNGRKVLAPEHLVPGDEVQVGGVRLVFDRPLAARVEMTDDAAATTNVNTVVPFQDLLRKSGELAPDAALGEEDSRVEQEIAAVIGEVSRALLMHRPLPELLEHVMDLIGGRVAMDRGVLLLAEGQPAELAVKAVRVNNPALRGEKIPLSRGIAAMAFSGKLAVLTSDAAADPRFMARESIVQAGIHSALCVPLWNDKEVIGVLYADRVSMAKPFLDKDLRLLTLLANLAAVKIENALLIEKALAKERMDREIDLAARYQRDFLPRETPSFAELDIAGRNLPCHQVGGDYFDYLSVEPGRIGFAIADVSGKGMSASLLMATLRAALHAEARPGAGLEAMARKLNEFVFRSSASNAFITFFYGELAVASGEIVYINAGHPAPFILGPEGEPRLLPGTGLPLGMLPDSAYDVGRAAIRAGETWVLYTDGISETRKAGEEFGASRIQDAVRAGKDDCAARLVDRVLDALGEFSGGEEPDDDRTLVVIKRRA